MKVADFIKDFRLLVGDTTFDAPDEFLITGLNWAIRDLPTNPKLAKLFSKHYTFNLDANNHYKWDLGELDSDERFFDRILDIEYLHFWETKGGQPCEMRVCQVPLRDLYSKGIPKIMPPGKPCDYAFERDGDKLSIVFDRPSNIPIIIDYVAYGIPKEVKSMEDEVPISTLCKNVILGILRAKFYEEADDMAFAGSAYDYIDNKYIPQLVEEIYKRMGCETNYIIGG